MNNRIQFYRMYIIIAIIVVILAVIAWVGFATHQAKSFHVVSTNPSASDVSTVTPFFIVNFNRELSESGLRVSSQPSIINSFSIKGKGLDIELNQPFNSNKTYTLTVSVSDTTGEHLNNLSFSFTPVHIPQNQLPKDQVKTLLNEQTQGTIEHSDPIVGYLPHDTIDYDLTYSYSGTKLSLQAQLFMTEADMSDESAAISEYEQEVTEYIQSVGLNPSNYTIQYTVQTP